MSSNEKTLKQALTEAKLARLLPLFKEEDIESVADFTGLEKEDLDEFVNELKGTKNKLSLGERSRLRVLFKELKALDSVVSPSFPESPMSANPAPAPVLSSSSSIHALTPNIVTELTGPPESLFRDGSRGVTLERFESFDD